MASKPDLPVRVSPRSERWEKKCACGSYIPDEYTKCDFCVAGEFNFTVVFDGTDSLGLNPLIPE